MTERLWPDQAVRLVDAYRGPLRAEHRATLRAIAGFYPDAFPSRETLAAELGVSVSAIRSRIATLERLGLLATTHTGARETRRAHRHILLPGFPLEHAKPRKWVEPRYCANERCRRYIGDRRAKAKTCSDACRQAVARAMKGQLSVTAHP